jgi:hypothetical protein
MDNKNNEKILKLILLQTFYLMINIEKHTDFEEQSWFYKYFQNFYIYTCIFLNINQKFYKNDNIICFPNNNLSIKEMKDLYCFIYEYILKNKLDYKLLP